ncbi:NIPSNAP family protein [Roseomonas chloroacetimidivorans]|uniref:NIPSNAP family protein n=1 Tax=Roseomonas chloroacetimidivorans TaxID=1766656 RepID=UPI003C716A87
MIVDMRIYTCQPNRMAEFVKIYETIAWEIQKKYLGRCLGWYTTVEGPLNRVVHLWAYDSQADREQRRAAMAADPGFQAYLAKVAELGLLQNMENRFVTPTSFFKAHLEAQEQK